MALSRVTTLNGLYLTNINKDFKFYHHKENINEDLQTEFKRLNNHVLQTIYNSCSIFLNNDSYNQLTFVLLNIQSLYAHKNDILCDENLITPNILALTETWIEDDQILLKNYSRISYFKRKNQKAAGVAIYVKKSFILYTKLLQFSNKTNNHLDIGDICGIKIYFDNIYIYFILGGFQYFSYRLGRTHITDSAQILGNSLGLQKSHSAKILAL